MIDRRKYLFVKPAPKDHRDIIFSSSCYAKLRNIPKSMDLRESNFFSDVEDQLTLGSCTCNALAGLLEYRTKQLNLPYQERSRLFLYKLALIIEGNFGVDGGAYIKDVFKAAQKTGVCNETLSPYDVSKFNVMPTTEEYEDASLFKISKYQRVRGMTGLKLAIAEHNPVVFGLTLYDSFMDPDGSAAKTGVIPMPGEDEQEVGGHAMLAVGYGKTIPGYQDKYIIVRNSWSKDWGDGGYCYIPESLFNKEAFDMWTCTL